MTTPTGPEMVRSSGTMLVNKTGSWRFLRPRYQDKTAPCAEACPAGADIACAQLLAGRGDFEQAWLRLREENPLTGVCGCVCFHPCESACNRGEYDEPVAINAIERFLADRARRADALPPVADAAPSGKRVAVVGAGPAGITAAHFLGRSGHEVDLYDAREEPGGLLRYAIPGYRLPLPLLQWELALALGEGVTFHPSRRLGETLTWEDLTGYDAVFVAVGAWQPTPLRVSGEEEMADGLALLEALRRGDTPRVDGEVAVLGGGNTALDVARTLLRLGAAPTVYYRRRVEDMPAWEGEIREAREEGVRLQPLLAPAGVERLPDGTLKLSLQPMQVTDMPEGERARVVPAAGAPLEVGVSAVYAATGTAPDPAVVGLLQGDGALQPAGLHLRRVVSEGAWAGRPPVFLGGDLVAERRTVVNAVASGKEAAFVIGALLEGHEIGDRWRQASVGNQGAFSLNRAAGGDRSGRQQHVVGYDELATTYFAYAARRPEPRITLEERVEGFDEIRLRMSESMAARAAERCFHCGLCDQCDNCFLFCPDMSVLRDLREGERDINYDYCKGCGVCVVECPRNAMVLEEEPR